VVKFDFYLSKLKKLPFFANNFKIHGESIPPAPPSDAHGYGVGEPELKSKCRRNRSWIRSSVKNL